MPQRFHIVSLGCAKNTVDSASMAELLRREGYQATDDPSEAQVLLVNTCGFIGPARQESLSVLQGLAKGKRPGQLLIAAGCLTQRYAGEVIRQVPGLDGLLGTRRWMDLLEVLHRFRPGDPRPIYHLPEAPTVGQDERGVDRIAVQGASAYLKIADGCRRPCAFCAIPLIKGTVVSRPMERILEEARRLDEAGVQEIILIAQDTTDYGRDLGMKEGLAELLEGLLEAAPHVPWMRILYAYPGYVTDRLVRVMAENDRILPYLDIPLQHADRDVLRAMRRPANPDWVRRTIAGMRQAMPDLAIRTTFIVGYPGETEAAFERLLDFVREMRFDRLGAFTFSYEPGTSSEALGDPISEQVKEERRERLMAVQQPISLEIHQSLIGKTLPILVEGRNEGVSLGRSYRDAPEIDGMVIVEGDLPVGDLVPVRITGALPYDLTAEPLPDAERRST